MSHNDLSFGTAPTTPYDDLPTVGELAANGRSSESPDPEQGLTWRPVDLGPVLRGEVKRPSQRSVCADRTGYGCCTPDWSTP